MNTIHTFFSEQNSQYLNVKYVIVKTKQNKTALHSKLHHVVSYVCLFWCMNI